MSQIECGDQFMLYDGTYAHLDSVTERGSEPTQTYNFSVEDSENYLADGVLVHNKTSTPDNPQLPGEDIIELEDLMDAAQVQSLSGGGDGPDGAISNNGGDWEMPS